jgi:hypothetical protein
METCLWCRAPLKIKNFVVEKNHTCHVSIYLHTIKCDGCHDPIEIKGHEIEEVFEDDYYKFCGACFRTRFLRDIPNTRRGDHSCADPNRCVRCRFRRIRIDGKMCPKCCEPLELEDIKVHSRCAVVRGHEVAYPFRRR